MNLVDGECRSLASGQAHWGAQRLPFISVRTGALGGPRVPFISVRTGALCGQLVLFISAWVSASLALDQLAA